MSQVKLHPTQMAATVVLACAALSSHAATVKLMVHVDSLVADNSVAIAPLNVAFHDGSYPGFQIGDVASPELISIAELGAGVQWHDNLTAHYPSIVHGRVGGILTPGQSASETFTLDTNQNRYFNYAAMVVPSNDFFLGNSGSTANALFDAAGHLQISSITVKARDLWDAGSEVFDPATAAFIAGSNAVLRAPQNSVIAHNFAEFSAYNGLTTAAGYTFHSGLTADQDVYRISLSLAPVPEPQTYALMLAGLATVGALARRRRAT